MTDTLLDLFNRLGFSTFESNEIENDEYNFEALNIETHPARDMHDTFYLNGGNLLCTHTSPRSDPRHEIESGAYIKLWCLEKYFGCDADVSHSPWCFIKLKALWPKVFHLLGFKICKHNVFTRCVWARSSDTVSSELFSVHRTFFRRLILLGPLMKKPKRLNGSR